MLFRSEVAGTAHNGEEAVEAVERVKPDVVTMDIHMPKVNGFDATRKIMESNPRPIVIVSGSSTVEEVSMTFRALGQAPSPLSRGPMVSAIRSMRKPRKSSSARLS